MNTIAKALFLFLGSHVPRRWIRSIVDFPGVRQSLLLLFKAKRAQVTAPDGSHLSINPIFHSNFLAPEAISVYEPEVNRALSALAKPGMVCYDIGANIGIFSFLLARCVGKEGKVYAFEPEITNYTCLRESLKQNAVENLVIETAAVGNSSGMAPFDHRGGAFSGHLIDENSRCKATRNIEMVKTITLDDYILQRRGRAPHLMKIDVEGNELKVLEGMTELLTSHGPIILCEVHKQMNDPVSLIIPFLRNYGYSLFPVESAFVENQSEFAELETLDNHTRFLARKVHSQKCQHTSG